MSLLVKNFILTKLICDLIPIQESIYNSNSKGWTFTTAALAKLCNKRLCTSERQKSNEKFQNLFHSKKFAIKQSLIGGLSLLINQLLLFSEKRFFIPLLCVTSEVCSRISDAQLFTS